MLLVHQVEDRQVSLHDDCVVKKGQSKDYKNGHGVRREPKLGVATSKKCLYSD
jgi:hypothetical protein